MCETVNECLSVTQTDRNLVCSGRCNSVQQSQIFSRRLTLIPNHRAACRGFGNDTTDCSKLVYISIYPRIIMSSSQSICLLQRKAGMSEAERVYICHMNCICSVFIQLMSLQSSSAEETRIRTVYRRLK